MVLLRAWPEHFVRIRFSCPQIDLEAQREVSTEEGREMAERMNIPFLESSAKNRVNVEEIFHTLVRRIGIHATQGRGYGAEFKLVMVGIRRKK